MNALVQAIKSDRFLDISEDIAQVFFASAVIEPLLTTNGSWNSIAIGFAGSIAFWIISLRNNFK